MIVASNIQNNLSRDHLLDQDMDNNNGPISPADLENIENNNAVDYIPNRNEIGVVVETTNFIINRNLTSAGKFIKSFFCKIYLFRISRSCL